MVPRAPKPEAQEGFIIIEVLVSALILAIVAGAVLTLITATTRGAAAQRDRSVAYDVAQADQARLRTLRITEINGVKTEEHQSESNGTEYLVVSERVYVNNKAGAVSCAQGTDKPDYVQLTTTVSSPTMLNPVVLQSVVSPSSGSLNPNYGTLDLTTANALGEPISGVRVSVGGRSAVTGTEGCAIFPSLPKGTNYTATYEGAGLIDKEGKSLTSKTVKVVAGSVEHAEPVQLDYPATLAPRFVYLSPVTGEERLAPVDSMSIANATTGLPPEIFGTPGGGSRVTTLADKTVFPYPSPSKYTVYAGSCLSNNPATVSGNTAGFYSAVIPPNAAPAPRIQLPALELNLTGPTGAPAAGAKVVLTDANTSCKSSGSVVKRSYVTNAEGHLSNGATGTTEAGIPFGTYNVCASLKVGSAYQTVTKSGVKVENFTTGTTLPLKLVSQGGSACT